MKNKVGLIKTKEKGIYIKRTGGAKDQLVRYVKCPERYKLMSRKDGYVMEHRLIIARILKRTLMREESVHHIDHNAENNNLNNLILFKTNKDHKEFEGGRNVKPEWSQVNVDGGKKKKKKSGYRDHSSKVLLKIRRLMGKVNWSLDIAADKLGITKKQLKKKMKKIKLEEKDAIGILSAVDVFIDYKLQQERNIIKLQRSMSGYVRADIRCKIVQEISKIQTEILKRGQELGLIERAAIKFQEEETEEQLMKRRSSLISRFDHLRN